MNTVCASCQATNRVPEERLADVAKCGRCGNALFDGEVVNATSANFDKYLQDDLPVVIDFWAPWCGPVSILRRCLKMSPVNAAVKSALLK